MMTRPARSATKGCSDEELRQLRRRYLDEGYKLYVSIVVGTGLLALLEALTHGEVRTVLLAVFAAAYVVLVALVVRYWLTTTRRYLGERRRRGLPIVGRPGQWREMFAQEERTMHDRAKPHHDQHHRKSGGRRR